MDHLKDAKEFAGAAECADDDALADRHAQLAIAYAAIALVERMDKAIHALIAIAERLPPRAETWSECSKRLRKEDQDGI